MNKEINKIKEKDKIEVMVFKKYRKLIYNNLFQKLIFLMYWIWNITENLFYRKSLLCQDIEKMIKLFLTCFIHILTFKIYYYTIIIKQIMILLINR